MTEQEQEWYQLYLKYTGYAEIYYAYSFIHRYTVCLFYYKLIFLFINFFNRKNHLQLTPWRIFLTFADFYCQQLQKKHHLACLAQLYYLLQEKLQGKYIYKMFFFLYIYLFFYILDNLEHLNQQDMHMINYNNCVSLPHGPTNSILLLYLFVLNLSLIKRI